MHMWLSRTGRALVFANTWKAQQWTVFNLTVRLKILVHIRTRRWKKTKMRRNVYKYHQWGQIIEDVMKEGVQY